MLMERINLSNFITLSCQRNVSQWYATINKFSLNYFTFWIDFQMIKLSLSNSLNLQNYIKIKKRQNNNYLAFIFGFSNFNLHNMCFAIQLHPSYSKVKSPCLKSNSSLEQIPTQNLRIFVWTRDLLLESQIYSFLHLLSSILQFISSEIVWFRSTPRNSGCHNLGLTAL